jgi:hypothetical protein
MIGPKRLSLVNSRVLAKGATSKLLGSEAGRCRCADEDARFAEIVVSFARKAVVDPPVPAYRPREDGYADWVILAIQASKSISTTITGS